MMVLVTKSSSISTFIYYSYFYFAINIDVSTIQIIQHPLALLFLVILNEHR